MLLFGFFDKMDNLGTASIITFYYILGQRFCYSTEYYTNQEIAEGRKL